uniref:uncharacterized protein LOC120347221 n=1 Tax=Styela clava TaxID=7725 RepID=UPI0019394D21|nr:uncharacterized protein LOC120347221 [Styela clava]
MKVIVAGFSKTGTKSMCDALTKLGYNVYDVIENMYILEKEWTKILNEGWTTEDFRRMYENVDAVTDLPACYFWEEIHKAFPDAKIILTIRDDEDKWYKSFENQYKTYDSSFIVRLMAIFSPTFRRVDRDITVPLSRISCGLEEQGPFRIQTNLHEQILKMKYRAHNAYVLQNAPPDKLLVFRVTEGWEPLCKFLGIPIPDEPFPHKNVGGDIVDEMLKTNPTVKRMEKEFMASFMAFIALCAIGGYSTYKYGFWATATAPFKFLSDKFYN